MVLSKDETKSARLQKYSCLLIKMDKTQLVHLMFVLFFCKHHTGSKKTKQNKK